MMGTTGYPETSVKNYHYSLCNTPEERSSAQLRGGRLKSQIWLKELQVKGPLARPRYWWRIIFNECSVRMHSGFIWLSRLCVLCIYWLYRRLFVLEAELCNLLKTYTELDCANYSCLLQNAHTGSGVHSDSLISHPHLVRGLSMGSPSTCNRPVWRLLERPTQWHVSNNTHASSSGRAATHTQTENTRNRSINTMQTNVKVTPCTPARQRYGSNQLALRHWNQMGGQHHAAAALTRLKTLYPSCRRRRSLSGWNTENLAATWIRSPDRPARSESLYRLRYSWLHIQILQEAKRDDKLYLFYVLRLSKPNMTVLVLLWKRKQCAI